MYYAACLALLIGAAALRFYNLSEHSLSFDEAVVANNSNGGFWEVVLHTRHENSSPLLYPYMLWAAQLVESSPFSIRFIPALASTLTVSVFLFLLPRAGISRPVAFISGLLAALSPAGIEHARDAREYGLDALIAVLMIAGLLLYLRDRKKFLLCCTLFLAPILQYGLALFSVAVIAAILVASVRAALRDRPDVYASDRLRAMLELGRDLIWPCACFALGCAIALVTLSGQWDGSGWAVSGYLRQSYYHGQLYNPADVLEFLVARLWRMFGYHVWEVVAALALALFAFLLSGSWRRPNFDAIPIVFALSIAIVSCAALLKMYPLGDIRQNIYLGPIIFLGFGYAFHSTVQKFTLAAARNWLMVTIVLVVAAGGIYDLIQTNPYRVRIGVKQAMIALEEHRKGDDAVYVGSYAAPVVWFYDKLESDYYFYGQCGREDLERCSTDIRDTIRFILDSRPATAPPPERLFLMFDNNVPRQTLKRAIGGFYEGEIKLVSVSGGKLYVLNDFPDIATQLSPVALDEDVPPGDVVINGLFRVFLNGNEMTYLKRPCSSKNAQTAFFLSLAPADKNELPIERRKAGFEELNFNFDRNGFRDDGSCMTTIQIPEYDIERIRTGQYPRLKSVNLKFLKIWDTGWQTIRQP